MTDRKDIVGRLRTAPLPMAGCGNHFCFLRGTATGQATNGACRCVEDFPTRTVLAEFHRQRAEAASTIEDLRAALTDMLHIVITVMRPDELPQVDDEIAAARAALTKSRGET